MCISHLCSIPTKTDRMILTAGVIEKVFCTNFIRRNHIRFTEGLAKSEDRIFLVDVLLSSGKVFISEQMLYLYRINQHSVSNKFNENIQHVTDSVLHHCKTIIMNKFGADDGVFLLFLENRVSAAILDNMALNIFHKKNPLSFLKRRRLFFEFLAKEPYHSVAEKKYADNYMTRQNRILLWNVRKRNFFLLNIFYRHSILLAFVSAFLNRIEKLTKRIAGK